MELVLLPNAVQDLSDARAYFEEQREGLAGEFDTFVEEALSRLQRFPRASIRLRRGYRLCQLKKFRKHGILYKIRKKLLVIHGVIHLQRGRRFWKERLA